MLNMNMYVLNTHSAFPQLAQAADTVGKRVMILVATGNYLWQLSRPPIRMNILRATQQLPSIFLMV